MDSLITAAGLALARGDPLGALQRVALRNDPPALALRGIAMARLGELARAKDLLRRAGRGFGAREPVARARCIVAEVEIALASRDLAWPPKALETARATLEAHGDRLNAAYAYNLDVRRLVLIGRVEEAERKLSLSDPSPFPPALRTVHELVVAGIALRRLQVTKARLALERAAEAARRSGIAALVAEVDSSTQALKRPAARLVVRGEQRPLLLDEVEALLSSPVLVVDACRYVVRNETATVALATRPILFALACALADAWPEHASRPALLSRAFRARHADESHRARLRVEIGRLRRMLDSMADIRAVGDGFALVPHLAQDVVVLARPVDDEHADVLALLADGESWSSSALAIALGTSQRTVQRALDALAATGKVQSIGRGRARRWMTAPLQAFATTLLLPLALPGS